MQKKSSYGHRSSWVTENEDFVLRQDFSDTVRSTRAEIISHEDLPRLPEIIKRMVELEGLVAWLWVVLWRKEKILGLLGTSSRVAREFTPSDESVMIAVGRQLAPTLAKHHLFNNTPQPHQYLPR